MSSTSFIGSGTTVSNSTFFNNQSAVLSSSNVNNTLQNLQITGNLTVAGTTISQNSITVDDGVIRLGNQNVTSNIGLFGEYGAVGSKNYPAIIFDIATAKHTIWNGTTLPTNTTLPTLVNGYPTGTLRAQTLEAHSLLAAGGFIQTPTNHANAFRVRDSANVDVLNVDTTTDIVTLNNTLVQPPTDSANAFRVNTRLGAQLMTIDNTVGNAICNMQFTTLNLAGSNTNLRPSSGGAVRVQNQAASSTWMTISGLDGTATFQNSTNSANAFRVQDAGGLNILAIDTTAKSVTYGNGTTGTFASPSANGIQMDAYGSIAFKSTANNSNQWIVTTTGGGVPFSIDNNIAAGGSGVYTWNHTLDNGTGSARFKTGTNSTTGFQVQDASNTSQFTVNTTNGNCLMLRLNGGSATPTFTLGTGAGTGATATISGNQMAGRINLTTGTTPTAGANVITVTYPSTWSTNWNPVVVITPSPSANTNGNHTIVFVSASVSTGFILTCWSGQALNASSTYNWNYHVIGG